MPWIVRDDLISKYNVRKMISPEMVERIAQLKCLRNERGPKTSFADLVLKNERKEAAETIKYPIFDEYIPPEKQTDPAKWPVPKKFSSTVETIIEGCLELWQFLQAFGANLEVAPMSLANLISALLYCQENNPILEAITLGFFSQFNRTIRSNKAREERITEYLDEANLETRNFIGKKVEPCQVTLNDKDVQEWLKEQMSKSRKEPKPWFLQACKWLVDLRTIPEIEIIIANLVKNNYGFADLDVAFKMDAMLTFKNFYLTAISLRSFVDREIEAASDIKQQIREAESEARRLAKQGQEMLSQHDLLKQQLEDENVMISTVKRLCRETRKLDEELSKMSREEAKLNRKIDELKKRQYDHGAVRTRLLGEDREYRRYWWFDLHLHPTLVKSCGAGIIIIEDSVDKNSISWSFYDEPEHIEELLAHLNPLGVRESRLASTINEFRNRIEESLFPFPHVEDPSKNTVLLVDAEKSDSHEEGSSLVHKRMTKKSRRPDLPEFLRYRNVRK